MNILICSKDNEFSSVLARRLGNENHEVYLLSEKENEGSTHPTKVLQKYEFNYSNENIVRIMRNIVVDVVLIAGYIDFLFEKGNAQKKSVEYITGMTNLLVSAELANVKRIVYCSTLDNYKELFSEKDAREKSHTDLEVVKKSLEQVEATYATKCSRCY